MKTYTDLTRSKNPITAPDKQDLAQAHEEVEQVDVAILGAEELIKTLQLDAEYAAAVKISIARVHQLNNIALNKPLTEKTMMWHARNRGQQVERWAMLRERIGLRECIEGLQKRKLTVRERIREILDKMEKQEKKGSK